jgi:hypothetical protein
MELLPSRKFTVRQKANTLAIPVLRMRKRNGNLAFSVIEILDRGGETGRKRDRKRPWKGETKTKIFFVYLPLKWKFDNCPFVTEGKKRKYSDPSTNGPNRLQRLFLLR